MTVTSAVGRRSSGATSAVATTSNTSMSCRRFGARSPRYFFVVKRKGTLTHAATGFDTGPSV